MRDRDGRATPICQLIGYVVGKFCKCPATEEEESTQDKYSRRLVVATVAIAVFAAFTAGVGYFQYTVLDKTNQTLKAEQRPWVWFAWPTVVGDLNYTDTGASLAIKFDLVNTGHSPALNVQIDGRMILLKSHANLLGIQKRVCDELEERPTGENGNGFTIFPGSPPFSQVVDFTNDEKAFIDERKNDSSFRYITPVIVGCVAHFFPADNSIHDTGFIYVVTNPAPFGLIDPRNGNVPAKTLQLNVPPFGSGRTN